MRIEATHNGKVFIPRYLIQNEGGELQVSTLDETGRTYDVDDFLDGGLYPLEGATLRVVEE